MEASLRAQAAAHAELLSAWYSALPELELATLDPKTTALVSVDVLEGFTRLGALASPRVTAIIPHVTELLTRLDALGVPHEHVAIIQDAHPEDAEEFNAYPPHCVVGTPEAEAVRELRALPNWGSYRHFQKNSIASHTSEPFVAWLEGLAVDTIIAVGDVTDLCLYTLALHLQVRTLARGLGQRVVVPERCTQTWDAPDHPGDLYHLLFLHQLARNGVEVVRALR
ncbi:cysteine hydrolase family protein [Truepera radiovictrix]|uniref:Isochorismatase hydrolase n=1 Tax=Truepera radiovictrix (strain DSM 17093 / CIP 108686 / LMG 22925 / RQ-24) TaxID=649638 RepID=D7CXX0_TRURR|nr:isochorismatase family cysteine hydrolase [Truepera radiovictrix]ADI13330.1 isochorismatase hydrolase [Truepera radiovictrix DSM 17093]WMT58105.1 isochorismatase family cysteine hydrolase [Truepera radiovictrix]